MHTIKTRFLLALALLAFVTNVLMPFYAVSGGLLSANFTANASSLFGEKILICTSAGYQWVSLSYFEDAPDTEPEDQHNSYLKCPLCYLVEDETVDVINSHSHVVAVFEHRQTTYYRFLNSTQHVQRLPLSGRHTRAPPHIIS